MAEKGIERNTRREVLAGLGALLFAPGLEANAQGIQEQGEMLEFRSLLREFGRMEENRGVLARLSGAQREELARTFDSELRGAMRPGMKIKQIVGTPEFASNVIERLRTSPTLDLTSKEEHDILLRDLSDLLRRFSVFVGARDGI